MKESFVCCLLCRVNSDGGLVMKVVRDYIQTHPLLLWNKFTLRIFS